jgi:8-oxo-dGTP pyrophosphatase MutT (NUDIX family)
MDRKPGGDAPTPRAVVPWKRTGGERAVDFDVFRVVRFTARSPRTGEERPFSVIETSDWVNVVALTPAGEVVCVRQFRHGIGAVTLEIPGGVVDDGEDPAAAAVRELREETGFEGAPPSRLGCVEPNPAILSNRCHIYLVRDAARRVEPALDPGEDIETVLVPLEDVQAAARDGRIRHALVLCALALLRDLS